MRERLSRGKRQDTKEWVYGSLLIIEDETKIVSVSRNDWKKVVIETRTVFPETVGDYTGLTDKNGTKIFEGDIVEWTETYDFWKSGTTRPHQIVFDDKYLYGYTAVSGDGCAFSFIDIKYKNVKVIGNIHDNPELLRGEE